jgi:flagella basal body P-ring formation protein FlgA
MVVLGLVFLVLPVAALASREGLPSEVSDALSRSLAFPGRVVPVEWALRGGCKVHRASVSRPIEASGRVAVKVAGEHCAGWGWVRLQVWAETAVTIRTVRAGEEIASAVTVIEQEIQAGRTPFSPPPGSVATHALSSGVRVAPEDVSNSVIVAGDPIKILVVSGAVAVETQGRRISCARGHACAVLPSGRHVEGRIDDGRRLVVEVP